MILTIKSLPVAYGIASTDMAIVDATGEHQSFELACYPKATNCGGDIIMLLWFPPCAHLSVRLCITLDLVNTID